MDSKKVKDSTIPKYKKIILDFENSIASGHLKKGDQLPSLNSIKNQYKVSKDTVLSAFNNLKNRGIVSSVIGKGYFVSSTNVSIQKNILMVFDELNAFKEVLYQSFINELDENNKVDIFFHHFNKKAFDQIIRDNNGDYTHYVIMPANLTGIEDSIDKLDKNKVYILDQIYPKLDSYSAVFQDFERDIQQGLKELKNKIENYNTFKIIYSNDKQPLGILNGFVKFCMDNSINFVVLKNINDNFLDKGDVLLVLDDKDLICVIKKLKEQKFQLIKDIGLISYNDNMLKQVIEGGITTLSTDFEQMGLTLANMINKNKKTYLANPFQVIIRRSL